MAHISRGRYFQKKMEEGLVEHSTQAKTAIADTIAAVQTATFANLASLSSSIYVPIVFSVVATLDTTSGLMVAVLDDTGTYKTDSRMALGASPFKNELIEDTDILILGNFETLRCLVDHVAYDFSIESMSKGAEFLELRFNANSETTETMLIHGLMYKTYPIKANMPTEAIGNESLMTFPPYVPAIHGWVA